MNRPYLPNYLLLAVMVILSFALAMLGPGLNSKKDRPEPIHNCQYFTVYLKVPLSAVDSLFVRGTLSYIEAGLKNPEFKREMMELLSRFAEIKLNQFHKEVRDAESDSAVGLPGSVDPHSL
jgi:hypothetical protein